MTLEQAEFAVKVLRNCRWDVRVDDKMTRTTGGAPRIGYCIAGRQIGNEQELYAFSLEENEKTLY